VVISIRTVGVYIFFVLGFTACERRQQIINQGNFVANDSTVLYWKEYLNNDSFFREVRQGQIVVNIARAQNEKEYRDSTFTETDFFSNGKPKATRSFSAGVQTGNWKSWYEDGRQKSSSLVMNGELRDYFSYYDNGAIAVTASRQPDGTMSRTERWRNGNLKEEFLTDSIGNGTCTNYHPNGKKSQAGKLLRFAPAETWQRWDSLGNAISDTTYSSVFFE
jgi:antitoxin component YwqK of YwqJK toxin-antitoxin module